MDQPSNNNKMIITVVSLIVLGGAGFLAYQKYSEPKFNVMPETSQQIATGTPTATPTSMRVTQESSMTMTNYKNGTYTVIGQYVSPGGPEEIEVTVTLADGVIKESNVISKATLDGSKMFQGKFIEGYKPLVVGKKLNEVKLDKVSGSSLTPKGFNDAIEKIKQEATS